MSYVAKVNGETFFKTNSDDRALGLTSALLELKAGVAGSFTFTIPTVNKKYGQLHKLIDYIDVYRNDETYPIFSGRITDIEADLELNNDITCEGLLSILSDSLFRPTIHEGYLHNLLTKIINSHNNQVESTKQIQLGLIQIPDSACYRAYENYETSMSRLQDLVESYGGYLRLRKGQDGILYLDWLIEFIQGSNQSVNLGENILDITTEETSDDIVTVLVPLGAKDDESGEYVTIKTVNNGKDYIVADDEYIQKYGYVVGCKQWDDVTTPSILKTKGQNWLAASLTPKIRIDVTAVDLANCGYSVDNFAVGYKEKVNSYPHNINDWFDCIELSLDLLHPENDRLSLGDDKVGYVQSRNSDSRLIEKIAIRIGRVNTHMEDTIEDATEMITGNKGGYAIHHDANSDGYPDEFLVIDNMDLDDALNVWRWNKQGFGHSSNGYDGPFGIAITMDGHIVANYIDTGTLTADIIKAGILRAITGDSYWNLETGEVYIHGYSTSDELSAAVATLQSQIDGNIQSWSGTAAPTLNNYPANQWTTTDARLSHVGDIYYDGNGKCYRFAQDGNTFKWVLISDTEISKALSDAAEALEGVADINGLLVSDYYTKTQTDTQITAAEGRLTSTMQSDYTSLVAFKSGSANNLIPYPYNSESSTIRGLTFTVNADSSISYEGTPNSSSSPFITLNNEGVLLKAGTYTLSNASEDLYGASQVWLFDDVNCSVNYTGEFTGLVKNANNQVYVCSTQTGTMPSTTVFNGTARTFTIESDAYARFQIRTVNNTIGTAIEGTAYPMLERGSVAHNWVSYTDSIGGVQASVETTNNKVSTLEQTVDGFRTEVSATYSTKSEAQSYASTAQNNAISTASSDATSKANQAKADAISTASTDATSKANAAESAAKGYTDTKLTSYSTTTQMNSAITQKANEITQTVSENYSSKTETKTAVDSIQIGGRNLLYDTNAPYFGSIDGDGSRYISDISTLLDNGEGTDIEAISDAPVAGIRYGMHHVCTATGGTNHYMSFYTGYGGIDWKDGETYTASMWVKSSLANAQAGLYINNASHMTLLGGAWNHTITEANTWQRVSVTFRFNGAQESTTTRNNKTTYSNVLYMGMAYTVIGEMWCCGYKLEVGTKATDWCEYVPEPNPYGGANILQNTLAIDNTDTSTRININGYYNDGDHYGNIESYESPNMQWDAVTHGVRFTALQNGYPPHCRFGTSTSDTAAQKKAEGLFGLTAGQTYTLSFDAKCKLYSGVESTTQAWYALSAYYYDDVANPSNWSLNQAKHLIIYNPKEFGTEKSARCYFTFTIQPTAKRFYLIVRCNNTTASFAKTGDYLELSNMKLEEGSYPTSWTASQAEYSSTKEVESKIEQKADSITASVASTYTTKSEYKLGDADNLIPYPYLITSSTSRGITFTVNADGSVSYSGTPSEAASPFIELKKPVLLKAGTYTLSNDSDDIYGCSNLWFFDDEACATNYTGTFTGLIKNSSGQVYLCTTRSGSTPSATNLCGYAKTFTINNDAYVRIQARTVNNTITTAISGTIYPMLERGSLAHRYISYADSKAKNQTVTDIEERVSSAELKITDSAIVSTVMASTTYTQSTNVINLLPSVYYRENESGTSWTNNGITWTVNKDGSITANGTATADSNFALNEYKDSYSVPVMRVDTSKKYILHGCPSGGSSSTYFLRCCQRADATSGTSSSNHYDYGDGVTITPTTGFANFYCGVKSGATVSNIKFYPMLEVGTIKHSYVSTHDGTGALATRMKSAESSITQNANNIALKVSTTDYTGNKIASLINQSATTVTINASKINLNGAVTANNYFKINTDGTMEATGAKISGDLTILKNNVTVTIGSFSRTDISDSGAKSSSTATGFFLQSSSSSNTNYSITYTSNSRVRHFHDYRYIYKPSSIYVTGGTSSSYDDSSVVAEIGNDATYGYGTSYNNTMTTVVSKTGLSNYFALMEYGLVSNKAYFRIKQANKINGSTDSENKNGYLVVYNGNVYVNGTLVAVQSSSSKRYKHDITTKLNEQNDPHRLYDLQVKQFVYNEDHPLQYDDMQGKEIPGFIAEDVAKIYPAAIIHDTNGEIESWDERRILPGMLSLMQEHKQLIDELVERTKKLEAIVGGG